MKSNIRKTYLFLLICYISVIAIIIVRYFNLPKEFVNKEFQYAENIELEIYDALDNQFSTRKVLLEEIAEKYSLDIVVYNSETNEEVVATVPYKNNIELVGRTNQLAVLLEAQNLHTYEDETMYVWYSIYHLSDYSLMSDFYVEQAFAVMISLIILIVFIILLQKTLYDPLVSIKESLEKLDNYELDNISGSYDAVNEKLQAFSKTLAQDIEFASSEQAKLSQSYEILSDRYTKSQTLLRSLIHDIKTPIQAMIIENELLSDKSPEEVVDLNIQNYKQLMGEVNEILELIKSDSINADNSETFDLVNVLMRSIPRFAIKSEKKNLMLNIDTPDTAFLFGDITTVNMLISNLLSNAINYSVKEADIDISILENDTKYILEIRNVSDENNIQRMLDSEVYFNAIKDNTLKDEHEYSSGHGLHLIKNLSEMLNAQYTLSTDNKVVVIQVLFDKNEDE